VLAAQLSAISTSGQGGILLPSRQPADHVAAEDIQQHVEVLALRRFGFAAACTSSATTVVCPSIRSSSRLALITNFRLRDCLSHFGRAFTF
jgi:hypothetical protein